jgi:cytochrome c2
LAVGVVFGGLAAAQNRGPASDTAPGLAATYRDQRHSVTIAVVTPSFYLEVDESLHPSIGVAFEAEWRGWITILKSASYRFVGDARVSIGEKDVTGKAVPLETGRHPIRIQYRRKPGAAALRLQWQAEHFPLEPVPADRFSHDPNQLDPKDRLVERGRALVEKLGCVNCHAADSASLQERWGPHLTGIGSRVKAAWLHKWLEDAAAFQPDAIMPAMLSGEQRRDVAAYLASLRTEEPFPEPKRVSAQNRRLGRTNFNSFGCVACHQRNALSLEGLGSKTSIGALAAYLRNPARFDPGGRMPSMMLTRQEAVQFAAYLTLSKNPAFEQEFSGGDPSRGRDLVESSGCLACHQLEDPQPLANGARAPALKDVSPEQGCLAETPAGGVPRYGLTREERSALRAFVEVYRERPDVSAAPVYDFHRAVRELRCVQCHEMNQWTPTAAIAERAPSLTGIGAKMRSGWLRDVMSKGRRIREGIELRMPEYDVAWAEPLIAGFAKAAGIAPGDGPPASSATAARQAAGVGILGTNPEKNGLACITCHGWGEHDPLGEDGPTLTHAGRQLRYDWFRQWMRDPARLVSGTSMPNYFGSMEPAQGTAKIEALWAALSMGERMPLPEGFEFAKSELGSEAQPVPVDEPIVIRWDMPEATPASIAVGLPGGVSYCFDAGESRLRYAWLGGYIDMTGTLYEKRDRKTRLTRTADILGEIFYRPRQFPLRVGNADLIPQRRFKGYRLVEGHPEFHYQLNGIDVLETVRATEQKDGIIRQFRISRVERPTWFLPGDTEGVAVTSSLGSVEGGRLPIPAGTDVRFHVTTVRTKR